MTSSITTPYWLADQQSLVGSMRLGNWCVALHEWLGDHRDTWVLNLFEIGDQAGITIVTIPVPKKDMTICVNGHMLPTDRQLIDTVAAMEHHRWTGHPIGSELAVKTAQQPKLPSGLILPPGY